MVDKYIIGGRCSAKSYMTLNAIKVMLENEKLKQTLIEIKEIAETCSFTDNIQLLLNRFEQILQKISEVENDNKNIL